MPQDIARVEVFESSRASWDGVKRSTTARMAAAYAAIEPCARAFASPAIVRARR